VARRLRERTVTGDKRRLERFREDDVHRVIGGDVVPQLPRATQKIEVSVTMEVKVSQIGDRLLGTA
jgi:hypothetical protein